MFLANTCMNLQAPLAARFRISQAKVLLSATHPLRVERATPSCVDLHDHDYYEIGVMAGGTARHQTADGVTTLQRGSVLIVPPGQVHGFARPSVSRSSTSIIWPNGCWRTFTLGQEPDGLIPLFLGASLFPAKMPAPIRQFDLRPTTLAEGAAGVGRHRTGTGAGDSIAGVPQSDVPKVAHPTQPRLPRAPTGCSDSNSTARSAWRWTTSKPLWPKSASSASPRPPAASGYLPPVSVACLSNRPAGRRWNISRAGAFSGPVRNC